MYCRFLFDSFLTGNFKFRSTVFFVFYCISEAGASTDRQEVPLPRRHFQQQFNPINMEQGEKE